MSDEYNCEDGEKDLNSAEQTANEVEKVCGSLKNKTKKNECYTDLNKFQQDIETAREEIGSKCRS